MGNSRKPTLSYECRERMETWLRANCPCAFDDPNREVYLGLLFICEEEVERAIGNERSKIVHDVTNPSNQ